MHSQTFKQGWKPELSLDKYLKQQYSTKFRASLRMVSGASDSNIFCIFFAANPFILNHSNLVEIRAISVVQSWILQDQKLRKTKQTGSTCWTRRKREKILSMIIVTVVFCFSPLSLGKLPIKNSIKRNTHQGIKTQLELSINGFTRKRKESCSKTKWVGSHKILTPTQVPLLKRV